MTVGAALDGASVPLAVPLASLPDADSVAVASVVTVSVLLSSQYRRTRCTTQTAIVGKGREKRTGDLRSGGSGGPGAVGADDGGGVGAAGGVGPGDDAHAHGRGGIGDDVGDDCGRGRNDGGGDTGDDCAAVLVGGSDAQDGGHGAGDRHGDGGTQRVDGGLEGGILAGVGGGDDAGKPGRGLGGLEGREDGVLDVLGDAGRAGGGADGRGQCLPLRGGDVIGDESVGGGVEGGEVRAKDPGFPSVSLLAPHPVLFPRVRWPWCWGGENLRFVPGAEAGGGDKVGGEGQREDGGLHYFLLGDGRMCY